MGSSVRIAVLKWSDIVAEYALFMLMTCLKSVWDLNFRVAAAIVNVFWGMMAIMPIFMKFIKFKFEMPDHWVVLLCSFAYTIGLGLLSFSTPKTVSGKTDNSNDVGHKTLFYMSLPFIAVARSGYAISLEKLINDEKGGILGTVIHFSLSIGAMFVVNVVGMTISYIVKQCSTRFGVPALCMVVSTLIFSTGFCSYGRRTTDSLFTTLFNSVNQLIACMLKLVKKIILCLLRCFCCCYFKYVDTTHQPTTEQRNDPVIEETKFLISLFPIFLLGLVSSLGNTFFLEQAYSMKHKILAPLLLGLYKLAKFLFPKFYFDIADSWLPACCTGIKRGLNRIGMALSLIFALLCCVIAAKVESRRLKNKGHEEMSILYLVPQFFLLGGFYGMAYESIERFFKDCEIPDRMKPYMVDSAVGVFGLGNIGSVLLVYVVHQVTLNGKKRKSWFNQTIDESRLDKYYWLLSVWTAANFVWYILVALRYPPKKRSSTPESDEEGCFPYTIIRKYCDFLKCLPERIPNCFCCCCYLCYCCSSNPKEEAYTVNRVA